MFQLIHQLVVVHQRISKIRKQNMHNSLMNQILLNHLTDARRKYHQTDKREIAREERLAGDSLAGIAPLDIVANQNSPRAEAIAEEEAVALREALDRLPADYRQVVLLRNWELLPFAEIGQRMDRTTEAARKLWVRAIEQLRKEFAGNREHETR